MYIATLQSNLLRDYNGYILVIYITDTSLVEYFVIEYIFMQIFYFLECCLVILIKGCECKGY
jgi:hypothetical protein